MAERKNAFGAGASNHTVDVDLSDFSKPKPAVRPDAAKVEGAARDTGFVRDLVPSPKVIRPTTPRRGRRTGRTAQISIKTTPAAVDEFYAITDTHNMGLGEAFERAIILLAKDVKGLGAK